jgi:hypothetical protein
MRIFKGVRVLGFALALMLPGISNFAADARRGEFGGYADVEKAKEKSYPFHGTLAGVDLTQKEITLKGKTKGRSLVLTSKTKITKNGHAATLKEAAVGDPVSGSVFKNGEGREEIRTLRIGKAEDSKKKETAKANNGSARRGEE